MEQGVGDEESRCLVPFNINRIDGYGVAAVGQVEVVFVGSPDEEGDCAVAMVVAGGGANGQFCTLKLVVFVPERAADEGCFFVLSEADVVVTVEAEVERIVQEEPVCVASWCVGVCLSEEDVSCS